MVAVAERRETPTKVVGAGSRGRTKRPPAPSPAAAATATAGPVTDCANFQRSQVVASAKVMHAAAAAKSTSWRTPATSRCVLRAFSLLTRAGAEVEDLELDRDSALCRHGWASYASYTSYRATQATASHTSYASYGELCELVKMHTTTHTRRDWITPEASANQDFLRLAICDPYGEKSNFGESKKHIDIKCDTLKPTL